ncbi:MAG: SpoIIE family protein phosphatase [Sedimentisphaerales bacterium]|nr:SpoIIE family protein phosphatase [Sedimentisphaerales bacterium]
MPDLTKQDTERADTASLPRDEPGFASLSRDEQIYQITTLVAGRFTLQEVLDKLAEAAVKITGVKACSIRLLDEDSGDLKMRSTYGLSEEYRNKGVVNKDDPVIKAAFAGKAVILDDMRDDNRVAYKEATIKEGLVSQLTVAMKFRERPIGVLRLYSGKPMHFDDDDIELARVIVSQCAIAITNARLYAEAIEATRITEQVRLAGHIQRRMIPEKAPRAKGFDISGTYIPCFDVGGDFYDFLRIDDNKIGIAIADVIGKGMPAAIMTSSFRGALRAYSECQWADPLLETVRRLNKMACEECRAGEFISLFYGIINLEQKTINYCNCGHEPPALLRNGRVTDLNKGGLVLGVLPQPEYLSETVQLKEGDRLMFYTDGLIDAVNFDGQMWGRDRLTEIFRKCGEEPASQMIKNILAYRRRFVGLARQVDDTSMVIIKVVKTGETER